MAVLPYDQALVDYARSMRRDMACSSEVARAIVNFIEDYTYCRKCFDSGDMSHRLTVLTLSTIDPDECQTGDCMAVDYCAEGGEDEVFDVDVWVQPPKQEGGEDEPMQLEVTRKSRHAHSQQSCKKRVITDGPREGERQSQKSIKAEGFLAPAYEQESEQFHGKGWQ